MRSAFESVDRVKQIGLPITMSIIQSFEGLNRTKKKEEGKI